MDDVVGITEGSSTAGSQNAERAPDPTPQDRQTVPYERFNEVIQERNTIRTALQDVRAELDQIRKQKLEEDENYKALAEQAAAEAEAARAEAAEANARALRLRVGTEEGLPPALIDRLRGSDEDGVRADARALLKAIPKPTAPPTDAGQPREKAPGRQLTQDEKMVIDGFSQVIPDLDAKEYLKYAD